MMNIAAADALMKIFGFKRVKPRRCRNRECRKSFVPTRPMQTVCCPSCALQLIEKRKAKQAEQKQKAERKEIKARKEKLKTRRDWINEAQTAVNAFVRYRDKDKPCICCGQPLGAVSGDETGGVFDAGHYRSTGSAPHLRFDAERNIHGQTKQCNRYGGGRAVDYRIGLIARIGLPAVEALEEDNTPRKWSIDELRAIRDMYRAKLKELKQTT